MEDDDRYETFGLHDSLEDGRDLDQIMEDDDRYETFGLHDSLEDGRDLDQIMEEPTAAEVELEARDSSISVRNKLPQPLFDQDTDDSYRPSKTTRVGFSSPSSSTSVSLGGQSRENVPMTDQTEDVPMTEELYDFEGRLVEWVARDDVRRLIAKDFEDFLLTKNHEELIKDMISDNKCSLEIDFKQFISVHPTIAIWLADAPRSVLEVMENVAKTVVFKFHPEYRNIHRNIYVRITNFVVSNKIRDLRIWDLDFLIRIGGIVTNRSKVLPQLHEVKYDCYKCGEILGPFLQTDSEAKVGSCIRCQSKGPFTVNIVQTIYRNYQRLKLQERPETLSEGLLPRFKEVILLNDLVDCARPGEEIEVTGIYTSNFDFSVGKKDCYPVATTMVEANYVSKKEDRFSYNILSDEDKREINKLAKDPRIEERIIKSIAPSIYGHENIKTAIALAMFGGVEMNAEGHYHVRGNINVLLLGDPSTAKSQLLKYVQKTGQKAVYTNGQGASAAGLTAAVLRDPVTQEWTLEVGAFVMADKGICLIDEFDQMNERDRVSIHEAMSNQTISIAKAGIIASLNARCSVIAAANPVGGRYNSSRTFLENVTLTESTISGFDLLFVMKDIVDPDNDQLIANFVVESHSKSRPAAGASVSSTATPADPRASDDNSSTATPADPEILPQDLLKKYITYAKLNVSPRIDEAKMDKMKTFYAELRKASKSISGLSITVCHLQSMIRMSVARARMHLRRQVLEEDQDMAICALLDSIISTQKLGVQFHLKKELMKFITFKKDCWLQHSSILK